MPAVADAYGSMIETEASLLTPNDLTGQFTESAAVIGYSNCLMLSEPRGNRSAVAKGLRVNRSKKMPFISQTGCV